MIEPDMSKTNISIKTSDGKEYPCRITLGAMRRFKQETSHDAESISGSADLAVFVWCCCQSACHADGVEFGVSLDDFCDRLDMEALSAFEALVPEKKTKK